MSESIPYTYLIGWSQHNKWYYGCRYAKKCRPSDLWYTYFTSSREIEQIREIYGEPDVKEVRRCFYGENAVDRCRRWEHKVLKRLNVTKNDKWINKTDNKAFSVDAILKGATQTKNKGMTPWNKGKTKESDIRILEYGKKVSITKTGKSIHLSDELRRKRSEDGRQNGLKCAKQKIGFHSATIEQRRKWSSKSGKSQKGKKIIHHPITKELKKLWPDSIQPYLEKGWVMGRYKKIDSP